MELYVSKFDSLNENDNFIKLSMKIDFRKVKILNNNKEMKCYYYITLNFRSISLQFLTVRIINQSCICRNSFRARNGGKVLTGSLFKASIALVPRMTQNHNLMDDLSWEHRIF